MTSHLENGNNIDQASPKVFGIGPGKTGMSSLAAAMRILGFRVRHSPRTVDEIGEAEFANDIAVAWRYAFLDHVFPQAQVILTIRDLDPGSSPVIGIRKRSEVEVPFVAWSKGSCVLDERYNRKSWT